MQRIAPVFTTLWHDDLTRAADAAPPWLWRGYLAPGNVTLLTGQWKCGKTTLLTALLSRLGTGGVLAGLPLAAGKAVVVTEESPQHWQRRGTKGLKFLDGINNLPIHNRKYRFDIFNLRFGH